MSETQFKGSTLDPRSELCLTFLIMARSTMMTELLDFFDGDEKRFLKFIDLFGGMSMNIPTRQEIAEMARSVHVFREVQENNSLITKSRLAAFYGLTVERINDIYDSVKYDIQLNQANNMVGSNGRGNRKKRASRV